VIPELGDLGILEARRYVRLVANRENRAARAAGIAQLAQRGMISAQRGREWPARRERAL